MNTLCTSPVIFVEIDNLEINNKVKYNKDGSIKRTHSNKIEGVQSEVYAFTTEKEISDMISVFNKHIEEATNNNRKQIAERNKLLFLIGINIGLRASDLRTLKWSFFFNKTNNGELEFKEFYSLKPIKQRKQGKYVKLFFNKTIKKAITNYISKYPIEDLDSYLFKSRVGDEAIEVSSLWRIIKNTAIEAGIKQNIGSHSLRKTWGFWAWHNSEDKNKALVILQQCFSHSSTQMTMKYIGIMSTEIKDMYMVSELGLEEI